MIGLRFTQHNNNNNNKNDTEWGPLKDDNIIEIQSGYPRLPPNATRGSQRSTERSLIDFLRSNKRMPRATIKSGLRLIMIHKRASSVSLNLLTFDIQCHIRAQISSTKIFITFCSSSGNLKDSQIYLRSDTFDILKITPFTLDHNFVAVEINLILFRISNG